MFNRATSLGTALTAGYRSDGLRAWKQDSAGNRTYYLYDGVSPLVEMDASGNWKGEYLYGPAGLISHSRSGLGTVFFAYDALGSVQSVFSGTGSLVSTRNYDAYGEQVGGIVADSTHDDPEIGYNGQSGYITDAETSLVLCGHRYYDPSAGRWLNRDPIGYSGGIGLYNYCANNPVMGVDTSGLQTGDPPVDEIINAIVPILEADCPAIVAAENEGNALGNEIVGAITSGGEGAASGGASRGPALILGTNGTLSAPNSPVAVAMPSIIRQEVMNGGVKPYVQYATAADAYNDPVSFINQASVYQTIYWVGNNLNVANKSTLAEWDAIIQTPDIWSKIIISWPGKP